jgi:hypothetical protein
MVLPWSQGRIYFQKNAGVGVIHFQGKPQTNQQIGRIQKIRENP